MTRTRQYYVPNTCPYPLHCSTHWPLLLQVLGQDSSTHHDFPCHPQLTDTLWAGLTDTHAGCPMGSTAENLAADYSISRAQSDAYALSSQVRSPDATGSTPPHRPIAHST